MCVAVSSTFFNEKSDKFIILFLLSASNFVMSRTCPGHSNLSQEVMYWNLIRLNKNATVVFNFVPLLHKYLLDFNDFLSLFGLLVTSKLKKFVAQLTERLFQQISCFYSNQNSKPWINYVLQVYLLPFNVNNYFS